jgi:hypothetical protein
MWKRGTALLGLVSALALWTPTAAQGAELTAFVSVGTPSRDWGGGLGASLATNWFDVLSFEGEAALLRGDSSGASPELKMVSFTASALVAPPIGMLTPYGGVGFGLFRQSDPTRSDTGKLRCFVLGVKLNLGLISLRGDYRNSTLSGEPLLPAGSRYYLGATVHF